MADPTLLAVPNVSEGRDLGLVARLGEAFSGGGSGAGGGEAAPRLLDTHVDAIHNRSVYTLAGRAGPLVEGMIAGAETAIETIDMRGHEGAHPCVGALDVSPIVYPDLGLRKAAQTTAWELGERLGGLGLPVFFYGELATDPSRVERAPLRRGGIAALGERMRAGALLPDHGPHEPHSTAGVVLVTARPPLGAFNVEVAGIDLSAGKAIAAQLREAGGGLPGVRAIALELALEPAGGAAGDRPLVQISTNIHDPIAIPLGRVVERVRELASDHGGRPVAAELIGLIPVAAVADYPDDVPIRGFDPARHTIDARLAEMAG